MTAPGAVVLLSCYELGHQPVGVAWPAGFLARAGFAPQVHDIAVDCFEPAWVAHARFVGIAVPMHTALRLGVRLAERVRAVNPDCHVCFYGLYAVLNADYLLTNGVDSCIGGEYEAPLVALVEALAAGEAPCVPGVRTTDAPAAPHLARLDFALPARAALPPLGEYAKLDRDGTLSVAGYAEASRGCKHRCLHCPVTPVYDGRFFVVPRAIVLEDIRQQVAAGATHITFGDPDFLNGPRHAREIARHLHAEFPDLTFDFTAKIEHIVRHRALFTEFAHAGCLFVVSAVEAFSDLVLTSLQKGHTRADVATALAVTREAGITLRPSLVPFTPWATLDDYVQMLDIIEAEGLIPAVDPVHYAIRLLVPPGSALLAHEAIRPYLGALDQAAFSYAWAHPDPRMDALHGQVAAAVEVAAAAREESWMTFETVRRLARAAAGLPARTESSPEVYRNRARVPRLTESWFC